MPQDTHTYPREIATWDRREPGLIHSPAFLQDTLNAKDLRDLARVLTLTANDLDAETDPDGELYVMRDDGHVIPIRRGHAYAIQPSEDEAATIGWEVSE